VRKYGDENKGKFEEEKGKSTKGRCLIILAWRHQWAREHAWRHQCGPGRHQCGMPEGINVGQGGINVACLKASMWAREHAWRQQCGPAREHAWRHQWERKKKLAMPRYRSQLAIVRVWHGAGPSRPYKLAEG
jgi:hypothetical protein